MDAPIAGPSAGVANPPPPRGDLVDDIRRFYHNGDGSVTLVLADGRQRVLQNPVGEAGEGDGPPLLAPVESVESEPEKNRHRSNTSGGLLGKSETRNKDDRGGQDA